MSVQRVVAGRERHAFRGQVPLAEAPEEEKGPFAEVLTAAPTAQRMMNSAAITFRMSCRVQETAWEQASTRVSRCHWRAC